MRSKICIQKAKPRVRLTTASLLAEILVYAGQVFALSYEERQKRDLSEYAVTDPNASYFDVDGRLETPHNTDNSLLLSQTGQLEIEGGYRQLLEISPLTDETRIPRFHTSPEEWRLVSQPLFNAEENVSDLAGSYIATGDSHYGEIPGEVRTAASMPAGIEARRLFSNRRFCLL